MALNSTRGRRHLSGCDEESDELDVDSGSKVHDDGGPWLPSGLQADTYC